MQKINKVKSVYIHIPFCKNICSYCDFCKNFYNSENINKYLNALKKEVENNYKKEKIKTLYIGGGTPSCLSLNHLKKLSDIINIFNLYNNYEFTFELNYEDITEEKLIILKNMKVNRLSIGIESFNNKFETFLNRKINKNKMIKNILLAGKYFNNISIDLMYGLKCQTLEDLSNDIDEINKLNINHVSIYALIKEEHTKLYIDDFKELDDDYLYDMYKLINKKLKEYGFNLYEISNFSKNKYESKHNMTYWKNENYYGFGLGASGFIGNVRYQNTKSLINYINDKTIINKEVIEKDMMIKDEIMLNLRMKKGINKKKFKMKYNKEIKNLYNINSLIKEGYLKENKNNIYIPKKYLFVSNEIILKIIE